MRDMVPRGDRSIRNIPVPASHKRHREVEEQFDNEDFEPAPVRSRRIGSGRWFWLTALLVVVVAAVGALLISTVFAGAKVVVFPRVEQVNAPARLPAALNAAPGVLSYNIMTVSRSATTTLSATGKEQVSRQASGKIVIYNNYSSDSQRLIANTRFQADDGKIYRIKDSVDVPGQGSTEATVYADSPGQDYNRTTPTRFTIPGFKDDPRFDKFYAESRGAITGGFIGEEATIAKDDLDEARATIEKALEDSLRQTIANDIPEGYFLIPNSLTISFSEVTKGVPSGGSASVAQTATAEGYVVRTQDLASYIALESVDDYNGEAVNFQDPSEISVSLASSTKASDHIELVLSGAPTLVWQFDPNAVVEALLGQPKGDFEEIIRGFEPAISRAEARIRPFWQSTFPQENEKIEVTTGNR